MLCLLEFYTEENSPIQNKLNLQYLQILVIYASKIGYSNGRPTFLMTSLSSSILNISSTVKHSHCSYIVRTDIRWNNLALNPTKVCKGSSKYYIMFCLQPHA